MCVYTEKDCDDNDYSTIDACDNLTGACENSRIDCSGLDTGCQFGQISLQGSCVPVSNVSDGVSCTDDICVNGNTAQHYANSSRCDDGNLCTIDTCEVARGCIFSAIECFDDGNPCTQEFCQNGRCDSVNVTDCVSCGSDADCDDSLGCTIDTCSRNQCVYSPDPTCQACTNDVECGDGDDCTTDTCDQQACTYLPILGCCETPSLRCQVAGKNFSCAVSYTSCVCPAGEVQCGPRGKCVATAGLCGAGWTECPGGSGIAVANPSTDCCPVVGGTGVLCEYTVDLGSPSCASPLACALTECVQTCEPTGNCDLAVCNSSTAVCARSTNANLCDDLISCTSDSCDTSGGPPTCKHVSNNALCDDGLSCTVDTCSLTSGCVSTPTDSLCGVSTVCMQRTCAEGAGCLATATTSTRSCICLGAVQDFCLSAESSAVAGSQLDLGKVLSGSSPQFKVVLRQRNNQPVPASAFPGNFRVAAKVNGLSVPLVRSSLHEYFFALPTKPGMYVVDATIGGGYSLAQTALSVKAAQVPAVATVVPASALAGAANRAFSVAFADRHGNEFIGGAAASLKIGNGPAVLLVGPSYSALYNTSNLLAGQYAFEVVYNASVNVVLTPPSFSVLSAGSTDPTQSSFSVSANNTVAGQPVKLTVQAMTASGLAEVGGVSTFIASVQGLPNRNLTYSGTGNIYTLDLTLTVAGATDIVVSLASPSGVVGRQVVTVDPAAAANFVVATDLAPAAAETYFSILGAAAADAFGNEIESSFEATITEAVGTARAGSHVVSFASGDQLKFFVIRDGLLTLSVRMLGASTLLAKSFNTSFAALRAPQVSSARIGDTGTRVVINFAAAFPTAQWATAGLSCNGLVDMLGGHTLGADARCVWRDQVTLDAMLGSGATIVPGDTVLIGSSQPIPRVNLNGEPFVAKSVAVGFPQSPARPTAVILAPSSVGVCLSFPVSGTGSAGGAGRSLAYQWRASRPIIGFQRSVSTNKVSSATLPPAVAVQFDLVVRNWLGQTSNEVTAFVTRASFPAPSVDIAAQFQTFRSSETLLRASVVLESCLSQLNTTFQWNGVDAPSAAVLANSEQSSTKRDLLIPAHSLAAGTAYAFSLRAALADSPNTFGESSTIVSVGTQPLRVSIPGAGRQVSAGLAFDVVVAASDPDDDPASATFVWHCEDVAGILPCTTALEAAGVAMNSSVLSVPAGVLAADSTYTFFVTVAKGSRSAGASTKVSLMSVEGPLVLLTDSPAITVATARTILTATVTGGSGNKTVSWSESSASGVLGQENAAEVVTYESSTDVNTSTSQLILYPGALTPGQVYSFTVTGSYGSAESALSTSTTVRCLLPPVGGRLEMNTFSVQQLAHVELSTDPSTWMVDSALDDASVFFDVDAKHENSTDWTLMCSNCAGLGAAKTVAFGAVGNWTVRLTVRDSAGSSTVDRAFVSVVAASAGENATDAELAAAANLAFAANLDGTYSAISTIADFVLGGENRRRRQQSTGGQRTQVERTQSRMLDLVKTVNENSVQTPRTARAGARAVARIASLSRLPENEVSKAVKVSRSLSRSVDAGGEVGEALTSLSSTLSAALTRNIARDGAGLHEILESVVSAQRSGQLCQQTPVRQSQPNVRTAAAKFANSAKQQRLGPATLPPALVSRNGAACYGASVVVTEFDWTEPEGVVRRRPFNGNGSGAVVHLEVSDSATNSRLSSFRTAVAIKLRAPERPVNLVCSFRPSVNSEWSTDASQCTVAPETLSALRDGGQATIDEVTVRTVAPGFFSVVDAGACASNDDCNVSSCLSTGVCHLCTASEQCHDSATPSCDTTDGTCVACTVAGVACPASSPVCNVDGTCSSVRMTAGDPLISSGSGNSGIAVGLLVLIIVSAALCAIVFSAAVAVAIKHRSSDAGLTVSNKRDGKAREDMQHELGTVSADTESISDSVAKTHGDDSTEASTYAEETFNSNSSTESGWSSSNGSDMSGSRSSSVGSHSDRKSSASSFTSSEDD